MNTQPNTNLNDTSLNNEQQATDHGPQTTDNGQTKKASIMKNTIATLRNAAVFAFLLGAIVLSTSAAVISVPDLTQTPTADATQQNDIATPNGGVVNDNVDGTLSYYVTTFTFGAGSQAHLETFFELSAGQDRSGVLVEDTGKVSFSNQGDTGDTTFDIDPLGGGLTTGEMAGQTVNLITRSYWHSTNDGLRGTLGTGDDILMNAWVNPTAAATETAVSPGDTNMLNDGDLHMLWNASDFFYLTQEIQNQGTPGGSGSNSILDTTVLTGANATFATAKSLLFGFIWNDSDTTDWNSNDWSATNWIAGEKAIFDNSSATVSIGQAPATASNTSVSEIQFINGSTTTIDGPYAIDFGTAGTIDVAANITPVTINAGIIGDVSKTGTGDLLLNGTVQGDVTVAGGAIGGNGTITGNLTLGDDAQFWFVPGSTLAVNGTTVDIGDLGINDLLNAGAIGPGTYTLIGGTFANLVYDSDITNNFGLENAVELPNGKLAYFQEGSFELVVIPEPSTAILAGLGLAGLCVRRRRRK